MPSELRSTLGLIIATALFVAALLEPSLAWFGVPALAGGALTAVFLFFIHRKQALGRLEETTDGANVGHEQPMFNMSSVKPTGIGGLLMAGMAVLAAAQYPQGRALLMLEVTGGTLVALALFQLHRHQSWNNAATPLRVRR
jgi:hypothetical protein